MSSTEVQQHQPRRGRRQRRPCTSKIDVIAVSDVDRAKQFYERLGWRLDDDVAPLDGLRIVQFTPPGSAASITFGTGITTAAPGSAAGGTDRLRHRGSPSTSSPAAASTSATSGTARRFPVEARQPGPDPDRTSYGSFCAFSDPDGNTWLVQEVTTRRPGRVDAAETAREERE